MICNVLWPSVIKSPKILFCWLKYVTWHGQYQNSLSEHIWLHLLYRKWFEYLEVFKWISGVLMFFLLLWLNSLKMTTYGEKDLCSSQIPVYRPLLLRYHSSKDMKQLATSTAKSREVMNMCMLKSNSFIHFS